MATKKILAIASTLLVLLVLANRVFIGNIGSGKFGRDSAECHNRMKEAYRRVYISLTASNVVLHGDDISDLLEEDHRCVYSDSSLESGWEWRTTIQSSDVLQAPLSKGIVLMCHKPGFCHGSGVRRMWLLLMSDGTTKSVWCSSESYELWFYEVFRKGGDELPIQEL